MKQLQENMISTWSDLEFFLKDVLHGIQFQQLFLQNNEVYICKY